MLTNSCPTHPHPSCPLPSCLSLLITGAVHLSKCLLAHLSPTTTLTSTGFQLMSPSRKPGLAPPPGVTPDFTSPYTLQPYLALTLVACVIITTAMVAARLYTVGKVPSIIPLYAYLELIRDPHRVLCLSRVYPHIDENNLLKNITEDTHSESSEMGRLFAHSSVESRLEEIILLTLARYVCDGLGSLPLASIDLFDRPTRIRILIRQCRRASWSSYRLYTPSGSMVVVPISGTCLRKMSSTIGE